MIIAAAKEKKYAMAGIYEEQAGFHHLGISTHPANTPQKPKFNVTDNVSLSILINYLFEQNCLFPLPREKYSCCAKMFTPCSIMYLAFIRCNR